MDSDCRMTLLELSIECKEIYQLPELCIKG